MFCKCETSQKLTLAKETNLVLGILRLASCCHSRRILCFTAEKVHYCVWPLLFKGLCSTAHVESIFLINSFYLCLGRFSLVDRLFPFRIPAQLCEQAQTVDGYSGWLELQAKNLLVFVLHYFTRSDACNCSWSSRNEKLQGWIKSARQLVAQFMPFYSAHSAYFNISRQKVPYFNVLQQNWVVLNYFATKQCWAMLKMWGQPNQPPTW